jgi:hypothetical protein
MGDLLSTGNTIHDTQIDILLTQTKLNLEQLKENFLTSPLTIESCNGLFRDLTECVENSYKIMSNIFKYISVTVILFLN